MDDTKATTLARIDMDGSEHMELVRWEPPTVKPYHRLEGWWGSGNDYALRLTPQKAKEIAAMLNEWAQKETDAGPA